MIQKDFDILVQKIDSINESVDFKFLLSDIKKFIFKYKNDNMLLDNIEKLINKISLKPFKKYAIALIVASALNVGTSVADVKDILSKNNISYNKNVFNYDIDINLLNITFKTGEYKLSKKDISDVIKNIQKNIGDDTYLIEGTFIATVSKEDNAFYNLASDDDYETFIKGGMLLEKRKLSAELLVDEIKKAFPDIEVNINVLTKTAKKIDRLLYFKDIKVYNKFNIELLKDNNDKEIKVSISKDEKNTVEKSGLKKDISELSRNYQFAEILKLGGIFDTEFAGDKAISDYSKWILKMRKHPEILLKNVKNNMNYDITFDTTIKNINIIDKKSEIGKTNIINQYRKVENLCTSFSQYVTESVDNILRKWSNILGEDFPNLTSNEAKNFENNEELFLKYLKQMYNKTFDFDYKK